MSGSWWRRSLAVVLTGGLLAGTGTSVAADPVDVVEVQDACGTVGVPSAEWPLPEPVVPSLDVCAVRALVEREQQDERRALRALELHLDLRGDVERRVDVGWVQFRWTTGAKCTALVTVLLRHHPDAGPDEATYQLACPDPADDRRAPLQPAEVLKTEGNRFTVRLPADDPWISYRPELLRDLDPTGWLPGSLAALNGVNNNYPYPTRVPVAADRVGPTPSFACLGGGGLQVLVTRFAPALCEDLET